MRMSIVSLVAAACALSSPLSAMAESESDRIADLQERIAELETRLTDMSASDGPALAEERAEQVRGLIDDVLADADARASLLQDGRQAGHDGKFFLRSGDGSFRLNVGGRVQARYIYNRLDNAPNQDENRAGFALRRTRLAFDGNVFSPNWSYKIQGDFSRSTGGFRLLDAQIGYEFDNGVKVRVGQFRQPFLRESSMSSARQLLVERSLVNSAFGQGRTQGIEVSHRGDNLALSGTFSDGFGNNNTAALTPTTEFALTGRAEYLVQGTWSQFGDFTSWDEDEFGMLVGGAAHYQQDEHGISGVTKEERLSWTLDASAEFGGANLFAAVVGNHLDEADRDQFGAVIQGGMFIVPNEWEVFARYEWGDADISGVEDLSVATVGFNRYINKHNIKWTTDLGYGLNEVSGTWSSSGAGWRTDAADEDGQLVIRSQLQLAF